jgi:hypothetical protein
VLAALVDHLWQSVCVFGVLWIGAVLASANAALLRLCMWRIAALKFLVPFHLLFAVGSWLGFPVQFPEDTVPSGLATPLAALTRLFAPAQSRGVGGLALAACVLLMLLATVTCLRLIVEHLRLERWRTAREAVRVRRDPDDTAPGLGFWRALVFTAVTLIALSAPVLAGAAQDRIERHALLLADSRALREATVAMKAAQPGMGARMRVVTTTSGVLIRNVTIRELAGLAYGVNTYFVRGKHFSAVPENDWLISERHDVRIDGTIREPGRFDTYALRRPITKMLAEKFGFELYVNEECQPPCGKYGVPMPDEGL